ncbi:MAG TPA: D-2-hydroxyacid dehydrogenase [Terriglobales bacterium]|nr:D-2-hydroxyacid dehydrogenase [Terriglobales bacterium]
MKILLAIHHRFELWNAPPWLGPRLQERFPEHDFVQLNGLDRLSEEIADAEVVIGWQLRPEQFRAARKLRWIHATTAAVHQLMFPELVASAVRVTNSTEIHGPVVAEHALALMFALAKGLSAAARYQAARHWGQTDLWRSTMRPRELAGATLGVIGLGAIGRESVRLAKAVGMKVIAMREHPERGSEGADVVLGPNRFGELLAQSDYVLLAAPLTAKTDKLFRNETFALMRKDACFLNVSRGGLVDEEALELALREHTIRAAALDVFETEPLPPESPLWQLDNLLITPHSAALTDKLWDRHFSRITENLQRYLHKEPLLGEVNKFKGY